MFKSIRAFILAVSLALLSLSLPASAQTGGTGGTSGSGSSSQPGGGTSGTGGMGGGGSSAQPSGQDTGQSTGMNAGTYRNDHDWGWVGLLGLLGLAGLLRRREDTHHSRVGAPGPAGTR